MKKHYDYIISGGGMAGLSLCYHLLNSSLKNKSILLVEPSNKDENDRTWSFWEEQRGPFEDVLFRKWKNVQFADYQGKFQTLEVGNYEYKMLRGIDFYNFCKAKIASASNITWLKEKVLSIAETAESVEIKTDSGQSFSAEYVFDSTYKPNLTIEKYHNLLQHFMGWVIETKEPVFNPEVSVMMNFGIDQKNDCRFIYVLPFSKTKALIEFTLFSDKLLSEDEYRSTLQAFIEKEIKVDFTIDEQEFGVIPMSDEPMKDIVSERIIRIGTAGGATNPATGYTFQNAQKDLKGIVLSLEKSGKVIKAKQSFFKRRFPLYASILLNVLENKRYPAAQFFSGLYAHNPAWKIFRFLDNESNFGQELAIMWSTPKNKFIAGAIDVFKRKLMGA